MAPGGRKPAPKSAGKKAGKKAATKRGKKVTRSAGNKTTKKRVKKIARPAPSEAEPELKAEVEKQGAPASVSRATPHRPASSVPPPAAVLPDPLPPDTHEADSPEPPLAPGGCETDPLERFFFQAQRTGLEPALAALRAAPEAGWQGSDDAEVEAYLTFRMADEWYVVPIVALQEIVRPLPLTPVPRTPAHVEGVVTLRGTVLPVLDLHLRLGLLRPDLGRTTRLLVFDSPQGAAAFVVEEVGGVWRPEAPELEAPPTSLGARGDLIETILREGTQVLPLLDLGAALAVDLARADEVEGS